MLCAFLRTLASLILAGIMLFSLPAQAFCFNEAGARYKVDPQLLRSMATVESSLNPQAIGKNRDKQGKITSRDYGLMQINDRHIPQLQALGIIHNEQDLLNNTCLNVQIGAWILAKHLKQCGVNWQCLGSYNAGFADNNSARRMIYARKVYNMYLKLQGGAV
ncbi:TPA: lytic transglycosylase domain-containing protein [Yersinia enterocolitica]|uniref:lytic transglycosylase domain-containing protein n=1 Tax=Yersinia TaxID=629 RepID=UPI0005E93C63|nr:MULTISPECIES: lytic transglycosylase domain-containing protein [Yersinia]CNI92914.1 transglycosylase SLT domain-containing protein [Yersinia intermedia]HDL7635101.1 lytic transglycosylase domain-containing protein [Yersinia enterocolitica]HDY4940546.1 lytic transglycosylase domain-containing protein [Yersinia enterocolitica]HEA9924624.1 lytic transglycosylase domain-containing protein [Yersinia enterocolitica]